MGEIARGESMGELALPLFLCEVAWGVIPSPSPCYLHSSGELWVGQLATRAAELSLPHHRL